MFRNGYDFIQNSFIIGIVYCLEILSITLIFVSCSEEKHTQIVNIEHVVQSIIFNRKDNNPDFETMLSSYSNIDNMHIMTFHGNFDELILIHHNQIMEYLAKQETLERDSLYCSLFTYFDKTNGAYLGRNFDNKDTDLLVGLFIPDSGYASIGFVPLMEFKFDQTNPFDSTSEIHRRLLLHSAAVTVDGINEMGVTVTVASVGREAVRPDTTKPYRFLLHLKRNILDHAYDLESAIEIASHYNLFDNGKHLISHHILIADPNNSAILEWNDGQMRVMRNSANWQIATNSKMYNVSTEKLRRECNRYNSIHKRLINEPDTLSWQQGMDALQSAEQVNKMYHLESGSMMVNTQWSAVFDLKARVVIVCMNREYDKVYRFKLYNKKYYQNNSN